MHRGLSVLLLAVTTPFSVVAAPQAVVPPLRTGAGVPDVDRAEFDQQLRAALATRVEVLGAEATGQALAQAGAGASCGDATCARLLADATGARFVVLAYVSNEAEIYKVTGAIFDAAHDKVTATASKTCELCAAGEVVGTIEAAVAGLATALAAPAPEPSAPTPAPVAADKAPLQVRTEPPGARVSIDGEPAGETPLTAQVEAGGHTVVLEKEGFVREERAVTVDDDGLELSVSLQVAAEPSAALAAPTVEAARDDHGTAWAWGTAIGGVLAAGAGTALVLLDGEVTCTDGRGRSECPTVYNTKVPGMLSLAAGAAALGVGITLLTLEPGNVPTEATLQPTAGGAALHWSGRF